MGVARQLVQVDRELCSAEADMGAFIEAVPVEHRDSARNLVHYLALRGHDLRDLQRQLAQLGLSSLGRSEAFVRASVLQVARRAHEALALRGIVGARQELRRLGSGRETAHAWETARQYLHQHTRDVLGPRPDDRHIYIMVTAPGAHEADAAWMEKMLRVGMNVLRVNCAHGGPDEWRSIVEALHAAQATTGKECRVLMDLAGPKIRTGPVEGARHIATWKPARDEVGNVIRPARVVLRRASVPLEEGSGQVLLLADKVFRALRRGDVLRLRDARGKKRRLRVRELGPDEIVAHAAERAYIDERARVRVFRRGVEIVAGSLEVVGGEGAAIDVKRGETLVLTARAVAGAAPRRDREGRVVRRGIVSCTLPAALDLLEVGHRVLFDEGRVEAVVVEAHRAKGDYLLEVTRTTKETIKLRAEKGINLPDTVTRIAALTADDLAALPFVVANADAVSLSFVRRPEDVRMLHEALDRLERANIAVVLKIETRAGFENLPRLILEGLRRPPMGVMIARGDLAVEVGYERLAELQEEILWLCEASHVPAIWATQVLDGMARTGVPSRAEVTDAAASVAAECVMLNKGPFVDEAVRVLADILRRMEKHRDKKRSLYRKLRVSLLPRRSPTADP